MNCETRLEEPAATQLYIFIVPLWEHEMGVKKQRILLLKGQIKKNHFKEFVAPQCLLFLGL